MVTPSVARLGSRLGNNASLRVALLAAPFVLAVIALDGLTRAIDTFHGTDEGVYHVPTIQAFASQLPTPDLTTYRPAQTPLFHLVFAGLGELFGMELWRLRLINAAISFAAVLVLYRLLRRRALAPWTACAIALLFAISPYFFGVSFLLLTDNLATLFILLALSALDQYGRAPRSGLWIQFCVCMSGAVLTRQSSLWLAPVGLWVLASAPLSPRARASSVAGVALALLPFAALVLSWGDLAPRGSANAPCGVCVGSLASARPLLFALAIIGVYSAALYLPRFIAAGRARGRQALVPVAASAAAGLLALVAVPLHRESDLDAGWLWQVSDVGPSVAGTSWLFWVLVPLGCASLAALLRRTPATALPTAVAICFLASTVVIALVYQKYFDPTGLLVLALAAQAGDLRRPWELAGVAILMIAFVLYAVTFSAAKNEPTAIKPAAAVRHSADLSRDGRRRVISRARCVHTRDSRYAAATASSA